tara:strand:+ start:1600 stop:2865 length:1266 start_codon:yes stop_codon:yes gene_type:complete
MTPPTRHTTIGLGLTLAIGGLAVAATARALTVGFGAVHAADSDRGLVRQNETPSPGNAGIDSISEERRSGPRPLGVPMVDSDPIGDAMRMGLDYLAEQQTVMRDGSVPAAQGTYHAPIGVTALAALAWMSGGSTPTRGPHSGALVRSLEYLLGHQVPVGEERAGWIGAPEDQQSKSHGHGLATLALSQAFTLSPRSPLGHRIQVALEASVERIKVSQGIEGGWYYEAQRSPEHEGSVTVCHVQALRGARNAGIHVDPNIIANAIAYVRRLQTDEGGFQYSFTQPETSVALTGACLSTMHAAGIYEDKDVERAYDWIWRELAAREDDDQRGVFGSQAQFPFYERFYLSQALWHNPDEEVFRRWSRPLVRQLLVTQSRDGSWSDVRYDSLGTKHEGRYGSCYATAMNVLFLSVPEGTLPIFRR